MDLLNDYLEKEPINPDNKSAFSRDNLLIAADVFQELDWTAEYKTPEEKTKHEDNIIKSVRISHSEAEINAAVRVSLIRNRIMTEINERVRTGERPEDIQNERILLEKESYISSLKELKVEYLRTRLEGLKGRVGADDFEQQAQNAEISAIKIANAEMVKWQDIMIDARRALNPEGWDHIINFFKHTAEKASKNKLLGGYFGMNRNLRTALTAGIIGGGIAAFAAPLAVAAGFGGAGFVAYRICRSLIGGNFGYFLSKKVFQPLAKKSFESKKNIAAEFAEGAGVSESKDIFKMIASGEVIYYEHTLSRIAEQNIKIAGQYAEKMRRITTKYKIHNVAGTVLSGVIGGMAGMSIADMVLGAKGNIAHTVAGLVSDKPKVMTGHNFVTSKADSVLPDKVTITPPQVESTGDGAVLAENAAKLRQNTDVIVTKPRAEILSSEVLERAIVGEGKGVTHVLQRQLEADPKGWGYTGDATDAKALRAWSGAESYRIAVKNGYINPSTGAEVWVLDLGPKGAAGNPAYVLEHGPGGVGVVKEYINGKPAGGVGTIDAYEKLHKPTSAVVHENISESPLPEGGAKISGAENVAAQSSVADTVATADSPAAQSAAESAVSSTAEKVADISVVQSRAEAVQIFEKAFNGLKDISHDFSHLSLAEQYNALYGSSSMKEAAAAVDYFKKNNLFDGVSGGESKTMLGFFKQFEELTKVFEQNEQKFMDTIKNVTHLDEANMNNFLEMRLKRVWEYLGNGQNESVSKLVRSVNLTPAEIANNLTVGQVLKARFGDGAFVSLPSSVRL